MTSDSDVPWAIKADCEPFQSSCLGHLRASMQQPDQAAADTAHASAVQGTLLLLLLRVPAGSVCCTCRRPSSDWNTLYMRAWDTLYMGLVAEQSCLF